MNKKRLDMKPITQITLWCQHLYSKMFKLKKKYYKGIFKMIFHAIAENNTYNCSIFEDILNQK